MPETVKIIGSGAFAECHSLVEANIPTKLTTLEDYAFQAAKIGPTVALPATLSTLGNLAFYDCKNITSFSIPSSNSTYKTVAGIVYNKKGTAVVSAPAGLGGTITVPSGVTTIGENAFIYSSASRINLPNTVKTIEDGGFCYADITSLTLPSSVTKVGYYIAEECRQLTSVDVGAGLKSLNYRMFCNCEKLTSVNLRNVTDLDMWAFAYCASLQAISIPVGVTEIKNATFGECTAFRSVTLPKNLASIAY